MDLPIENGDFSVRYVKLPEDKFFLNTFPEDTLRLTSNMANKLPYLAIDDCFIELPSGYLT